MERLIALKSSAILLIMCCFGAAQAQSVEYVHTDALGSVVAISDGAGQVTEYREYEPYGSQLTPAIKNGPGFTGHVQDQATSLIYMQQRYYDSELGIFLSTDPITAFGNPVGQFHRYRYANGNPYRFTDPDGRQSVKESIDMGAEGCGVISCAGWALTSAAWQVFGAEGISQIADKGWSGAGSGDIGSAALETAAVLPLVKFGRAGALVIGNAQKTKVADLPSGHAFRSARVASAMARSGEYELISMHRSLGTITGGSVRSRLMPDVAGLRPDGKIDITEVLSGRQTAAELQSKYSSALGDRMGNFRAVRATRTSCTGTNIRQASC